MDMNKETKEKEEIQNEMQQQQNEQQPELNEKVISNETKAIDNPLPENIQIIKRLNKMNEKESDELLEESLLRGRSSSISSSKTTQKTSLKNEINGLKKQIIKLKIDRINERISGSGSVAGSAAGNKLTNPAGSQYSESEQKGKIKFENTDQQNHRETSFSCSNNESMKIKKVQEQMEKQLKRKQLQPFPYLESEPQPQTEQKFTTNSFHIGRIFKNIPKPKSYSQRYCSTLDVIPSHSEQINSERTNQLLLPTAAGGIVPTNMHHFNNSNKEFNLESYSSIQHQSQQQHQKEQEEQEQDSENSTFTSLKNEQPQPQPQAQDNNISGESSSLDLLNNNFVNQQHTTTTVIPNKRLIIKLHEDDAISSVNSSNNNNNNNNHNHNHNHSNKFLEKDEIIHEEKTHRHNRLENIEFKKKKYKKEEEAEHLYINSVFQKKDLLTIHHDDDGETKELNTHHFLKKFRSRTINQHQRHGIMNKKSVSISRRDPSPSSILQGKIVKNFNIEEYKKRKDREDNLILELTKFPLERISQIQLPTIQSFDYREIPRLPHEMPHPKSNEKEITELASILCRKFEINFKKDKLHTLVIKRFKNCLIHNIPETNKIIIWYYDDGRVYLGEGECESKLDNQYKEGEKSGFGIEFIPGKSFYKGQFEANKKHGFGIMVNSAGDIYQGQWFRGEKEGYGKAFQGENNSIYEGEFKRGKYDGFGILKVSNEEFYKGMFVNGMKEGYGLERLKSGDSYKGYYVKNSFFGKGKYIWSSGHIYEGDFVKNIRHGKGMWKSSKTGRESYIGSYEKDKKSGYGKYTWNDGSIFSGYFFEDQKEAHFNIFRHGEGTLKYFDGKVIKGKWEKNVLTEIFDDEEEENQVVDADLKQEETTAKDEDKKEEII